MKEPKKVAIGDALPLEPARPASCSRF